MSDHWWKRKKRLYRWIDDSNNEPVRADRAIDNVIREVFDSHADAEKARRQYVSQFGGFRLPSSSGSQVSETYEPLLDTFENEEAVIVVAELPSVDKNDITIRSTEDRLTISVDALEFKYDKQLVLPVKVDPKSSVASYKNRVLEVHLKKRVGRLR